MKIDVIQKHGLMLNKKDINSNDFNSITNDLSVYDDESNLLATFYYVDQNYLYIPKLGYNMKNFAGNFILNKCNIIKDDSIKYYENNKNLFNDIHMKINPRNELQEKACHFLQNSEIDDKSLFLSPGSGKTAMSIMYFVNKKLKPLIITPDKNLMNQWKDSILEFTNITEDQIFCVEDGSNSFSKKHFSNDKLVYICCIKTLLSIINKTNVDELQNLKSFIEECNIDTKIIDECHLNLNAIFKVTLWYPTKENLYLSATMNRRLLQENFIHPGIVEPDAVIESVEYDVKPKLLALLYNSFPTTGNIRFIQDMAMRGAIDFNRYFNNYLLSSKNADKLKVYLDMIENICFKYIREFKDGYEHKIIIVAPSVKILEVIYEKLRYNYRIHRMFSKFKEKPNDDNFDIILGTQQQVTAGFDVKSLDVMISISLFTSQHNIKQLLGRILRSYPGKQHGQFISLIDEGFSAYMKYMKKMIGICENEISEEHDLQFTINRSKFIFPKKKS